MSFQTVMERDYEQLVLSLWSTQALSLIASTKLRVDRIMIIMMWEIWAIIALS